MSENAKPDMQSILMHSPTVDAAIRQAHREAIRQHRMANLPMVVWRDGAIVWIPPDQLPDFEEPPQEMPIDS